MKIPRKKAQIIHSFCDNWIPPFIRDSKMVMLLPFKLLFGEKAEMFFSFKDKAFSMSTEDILQVYKDTASVHINRETDLTPASVREVLSNVIGPNVLDIGCGRGYLSKRLSESFQVTAADFLIEKSLESENPEIRFQVANIENLPFSDKEFDTVISAHTLEHVQDINRAIAELRRVCDKRLIIIIPKQRPYRFTFDLHLHFFPYKWNVLSAFYECKKKQVCRLVGGDWFYMEY